MNKEIKKEYVTPQISLYKVDPCNVIATSLGIVTTSDDGTEDLIIEDFEW